MTKTVVALYDDAGSARQAMSELVDNGFSREDISLMTPDASGQYSKEISDYDPNAGSGAAQGAGIGAGLGAALGGFGGLLVGLGVLAVPGIGPVLAAGPLAAAVSGLAGAGVGAVAGGVTGGLLGALVDMGIPEERAHYYAEGVRRGGTLVIVRASDERTRDAVDIVNRYRPIDLNERSSQWRQSGWTRFDSDHPAQYTGDRPMGSYGESEYAGIPAAGVSKAAVPQPAFDTDMERDDLNRSSSSIERDWSDRDSGAITRTGDQPVTGMATGQEDSFSENRDSRVLPHTGADEPISGMATGREDRQMVDRDFDAGDRDEVISGMATGREDSEVDDVDFVKTTHDDTISGMATGREHSHTTTAGSTGADQPSDRATGDYSAGSHTHPHSSVDDTSYDWDQTRRENDIPGRDESLDQGVTFDRGKPSATHGVTGMSGVGDIGSDVSGSDRSAWGEDTGSMGDSYTGSPSYNRDPALDQGSKLGDINPSQDSSWSTGSQGDTDRASMYGMHEDTSGSDAAGYSRPSGAARRSDYSRFDPTFRTHFSSTTYATDYSYEDYQPAYRYGYDIGQSDRYRGRDWTEIEPDARRAWEDRNPGTWERVKESIRHAWEEVKDTFD
ncbi:MAG: hypothetical protein ACKOC5_15080 [Chloroflexota bacterium]